MSTSVSGLTTNFFPSPQNGFTTTTAGSVASGAATVTLNSVAGYSNGQIATLVIDPTDASKKQTFTGVVDTSGVQLTSVKWTAGTNQTHALGATVVDYATATHIQQITKGITTEHTQSGTHGAVTATSVTVATGKITTTAASKLEDAAIPLSTYRTETMFDHVASGGVWTGDSLGSTRAASMTALVCYINGRRIAVSAVTARTFTASKDTYIDVLDNADGTGTLVYTETTNNAASAALAANSLRIGIIVTAAGSIAAAGSINQGQEDKVLPIASSIAYSVTDSLGNLICPRDPNRKVLGYRQITSNFSSGTTVDTLITGLNIPVIVPTGRKIRVTFFATNVTTGGTAVLKVYEGVGSTQIQQANQVSSNSYVTATAYRTPAAGAQTYTFYIGSTVGNPVVGGAASAPAYSLVELV